MRQSLAFGTFFWALTARAVLQVPLHVQHTNALQSPGFISFIDEIRKNGSIPGIALGVVRLGDENEPQVQLGAWGRKTEEGDGHDLTVDTLFGLASCSKAFLATSLGILMDDFAQGRNVTPLPSSVTRFDYDTKVIDLLPEGLGWGLADVDLDGDSWATHKANIRDILGHVSGLPRHDYAYKPGDTTEDIVRRMSSLRTAYELREKWSYNNQMYMLGAHVVSLYAGKSYTDYAAERIFNPLKMSTTTFYPSVAQQSGKLAGTWTKQGRRIPFWFNDEMTPLKAGPGGILSTAEDMANWLAAWLNRGVDPVSNTTIFPQTVYDAVTTANWVVSGNTDNAYNASIIGYAMGWERMNLDDIEIVMHGGAIPGFSILTAFSPNSNIGVSILANADEKASYLLAILRRTMEDVLATELGDVFHPPSELPSPCPDMVVADAQARPPSLDMQAYTGSYSAPGYSPVFLCSSIKPSKDCDTVLTDFFAFDPPSVANASLYSTFQSIWATHVRLTHFSGDVFNITFTALFPHGYGQNTSAFEMYETGSSQGWVEFVVREGGVDGFSLVVDEDAVAARTRRRPDATLAETADAYFSKGRER